MLVPKDNVIMLITCTINFFFLNLLVIYTGPPNNFLGHIPVAKGYFKELNIF